MLMDLEASVRPVNITIFSPSRVKVGADSYTLPDCSWTNCSVVIWFKSGCYQRLWSHVHDHRTDDSISSLSVIYTLMLHVFFDGQNNGNYAIFNEPLIH